MYRKERGIYAEGFESVKQRKLNRLEVILKDKAIKPDEVRILRAFEAHSRRDWSGILQILSDEPKSVDPFIWGEHFFFKGIAHSFLADIDRAIASNTHAIQAYTKAGSRRGAFYSWFNQCAYFTKLGMIESAASCLREMKAYQSEKDEVESYRQAEGVVLNAMGFAEASFQIYENHLSKDLANLKALDETAILALVELYYGRGKLDLSLELLEHLMKRQYVSTKSRIHFYYFLFRAELSGKLIPSQAPEVIMESKEFRLKWAILVALQGGELEFAQKKWEELRFLFPRLYQSDFKASNAQFSCDAFMKYIARLRGEELVVAVIPGLKTGSKLNKLYEVLSNESLPIRKEELIERVWEVPYSPALDSRFYKLLERLRKKGKAKIISQNHAYQLH